MKKRRVRRFLNILLLTVLKLRCFKVLATFEVTNNYCLFERLFGVKKNGVFLFGISPFVLEIFMFFVIQMRKVMTS